MSQPLLLPSAAPSSVQCSANVARCETILVQNKRLNAKKLKQNNDYVFCNRCLRSFSFPLIILEKHNYNIV